MSIQHDDQSVVRYTLSCRDVPDAFVVTGFDGIEELNRPYRLTIHLTAEDDSTETADLLGRDVRLTLDRGDAHMRDFFGLVDEVTIRENAETLQTSTIVVVPALQALRLTRNTRIFQEKTTLEIVESLLRESLLPYGRDVDATAVDFNRLVVRDYCVQYAETNLDFVHRLLEEDGIGYHFLHEEDGPEMLVLFDDNRALERAPTMDGGPVRFDALIRNWTTAEPLIRFVPAVRHTPSRIAARDHDWTRASMTNIDGSASIQGRHGRDEHEVYEHGLERHLTIHENGGVAAAMLATISAAALVDGFTGALDYRVTNLAGAMLDNFSSSNVQDRTKIASERLGRDTRTVEGVSLVRSFSPGRTFDLIGHPTLGADGEYLISKVVHASSWRDADEGMDLSRSELDYVRYHNRFECLPLTTPWRPDRATPKPRIHGVQTATVTGPMGMDVHTDPHGRIKVRFHLWWNRLERHHYHCERTFRRHLV